MPESLLSKPGGFMQVSVEQIRISAQLLVMDALLESARAGGAPAVSANEIALGHILRMLAEPRTIDPAGLDHALQSCQGAQSLC
ncbi:hypothetical protein ACFONG_08325 [Uliginosibacterium paludis]|uniref:Uncharacterized protein n=1 Tax=Uliginosibacterium paludis TaxID=1615952 RepID=A0ABV2CKE4_9RHOO